MWFGRSVSFLLLWRLFVSILVQNTPLLWFGMYFTMLFLRQTTYVASVVGWFVSDVKITKDFEGSNLSHITVHVRNGSRFQWPCGLRLGSTASRLLRLWVWIPSVAWMSVSCECCVLSGVCVGLITRPEDSYWMWCVWVWSWSLDNEEALAH